MAAGTRSINIPDDGEADFQDRLAALIELESQIRNQRIYVVKEGESLSGIAQKFEVPLAALLIWNRIGLNKVIHPGQRLVIFPASGEIKTDQKDIEGDEGG